MITTVKLFIFELLLQVLYNLNTTTNNVSPTDLATMAD